MGQRSQMIISIPRENWGMNNSNNQPRRLFVYHNQWLYGYSMIQYATDLIKGIKDLIQNYNETWTNKHIPDYKETIETAINYANYRDILNIKKTYKYDDEIENYNKDALKIKDVDKWISGFDNNNGYLFVHISDKDEVTFQLINGLEDGDTMKIQTPRKYINLFYKKEEYKKVLEKVKVSLEFLDNIKSCDYKSFIDELIIERI